MALSSSLHSAFESLEGKQMTVAHTLQLLAHRRNAKGRAASESCHREPDSSRQQAGHTPVMGRTSRSEQLTPRAVVAPALPGPVCSGSWGDLGRQACTLMHTPARPSPLTHQRYLIRHGPNFLPRSGFSCKLPSQLLQGMGCFSKATQWDGFRGGSW